MAKSLGYVTVTTPGTPVRATANQLAPGDNVGAQFVTFQAKPTNTGAIYIGVAGMNRTTGVGVVGIVAAPVASSAPSLPLGTPTIVGLNAADYWIDADVAGSICLVSYIQ